MERERGSIREVVVPNDPIYGKHQGKTMEVVEQETHDGVTRFRVRAEDQRTFWVTMLPDDREKAAEASVERERGS